MTALDRRSLLRGLVRSAGGFAALALGGCDQLSGAAWFRRLLGGAETVSQTTQRLIAGRRALAQEFTPADIASSFKSNGTGDPGTPEYAALVAGGFADWRLEIDGLVEHPQRLSLAEIRTLPARGQITRHDCVEGWSCIAEWRGARLSAVLDRAGLQKAARYIVFHCADSLAGGGFEAPTPYYESIDLDDAFHEQTILAYEMNGKPLPVANGAPLRLRVERQLGYKHAKYIMRIEAVATLQGIGGGKGGFWEDNGYAWYAGI